MPLAIAWTERPACRLFWLQLREPLLQLLYQPWLQLREPLLLLLYQPWLVLPLQGWFSWWLSRPLPTQARLTALVALMLLLALLYSPIGTAWKSAWLEQQLLPSGDPALRQSLHAVAVLVGRGPQVADATTAVAAALVQTGAVSAVYVSGDAISTAQSLERCGVPSDQIAGDSCARTTWENATRTAAWLRHHHPIASEVLITDPWQLPRAWAVFRRQGLQVQPWPAEPSFGSGQRNRIALRETTGTVLYALQGRF